MNKYTFDKRLFAITEELINFLGSQENISMVKDNGDSIIIYTELPEFDVYEMIRNFNIDANEDIDDSRRKSEANRIGYAIYNGIRAAQQTKRGTPERVCSACSMIAAVSALYTLDVDYASRLVSQVNCLL